MRRGHREREKERALTMGEGRGHKKSGDDGTAVGIRQEEKRRAAAGRGAWVQVR